jgi:hypothetical protein
MNNVTIPAFGAACLLALSAASANAQSLTPEVTFAVQNGTGFSSASLRNAITTRFSDRRPVAEYNLAALDGPVIQSATISGDLIEQFSFGFGTSPASILVEIFAGNGAADLGDCAEPALAVGTVSGLSDGFGTEAFSFDVTTQLQSLVDNGATHAAIRFRAVEASVGQVDIGTSDDTFNVSFDVVSIPTPSTVAVLGALGLAAARRRREG